MLTFHEITNIIVNSPCLDRGDDSSDKFILPGNIAVVLGTYSNTYFSIVFLHYLKVKTPIVHTSNVFLNCSTEYYVKMITNCRKFFHLSQDPCLSF